MLHTDRHVHTPRVPDKGHQEAGEPREEVAEIGNHRDESSNHLVEVVNDDDSHRDEGYSHGVAVVHGRNTHQQVDSRLDGMAVGNEIGSDHCAALLLESKGD